MACNITEGFTLGCKDSQGGIEYLYMADLPSGAVPVTDVDGILTGFNDAAGSPLTITFYKFEVPKQTSGLTQTINADNAAGTVFYQQDITMVFNKITADVRNQILLLAQNPRIVAVVKDGNGVFQTVGATRGAEVTAGTITTGVAYADRNGGELTVTGLEPDPAYITDAALVGE